MIEKDPNRYDDIINLPHFVSKNRKHMSNYDRAAQFAPFDALEGYDEAMEETSRTTDNEVILGDNEIEELNKRFQIIYEHVKDNPEIEITYFIPDLYKDGGLYCTKIITVKRIDLTNRILITTDNDKYDLDYISAVKGNILSEYLDKEY